MYDINYNQELNMVSLTLTGTLLFEDYKKAWWEALDLLEKNDCHRFLINAHKHREILVESRVWFKESFLIEAQKRVAKDIKVARINSCYQSNRDEGLNILRHIKEAQFTFNIHLFDCDFSATEWLLANEAHEEVH